MKMYFSLLFLFLASNPQKISAQQFSLIWEEAYEKNQLISTETGVTTNTGNIISFYTKQSTARKYWNRFMDITELILFDPNMKELKKVALTINDDYVSDAKLMNRGGNIYMLYNSYDKETATTAAYAVKIDEETLTVTDKILLARTSPKKPRRFTAATIPTETTRYVYSADSSLLLAFLDEEGGNKENKKFSIGVFDKNFEKQWSSSVEFEQPNAETVLLNLSLSNYGRAFVIFREKDQNSKAFQQNAMMHIFDKDNLKGRKIQLSKEKLISDARISFDSENSITVVGLYKTAQNGNINGVIYQKIDLTTLKYIISKSIPFPTEFLALIDNDGFANKKGSDPGISRKFYLGGIFNRPNGSIDIVAEFINQVYRGDARSGRWEYLFGDVITVNFSLAGEPTFTRIPKKQENVSLRQYMSYMPFLYNDKLIIMYNDDRSNLERDINDKPDKILYYSKSLLTAAIIDTDGKVIRKLVYDNKESEFITNPTLSYRISSNQIQIEGIRYRLASDKRKMGILTIK